MAKYKAALIHWVGSSSGGSKTREPVGEFDELEYHKKKPELITGFEVTEKDGVVTRAVTFVVHVGPGDVLKREV